MSKSLSLCRAAFGSNGRAHQEASCAPNNVLNAAAPPTFCS